MNKKTTYIIAGILIGVVLVGGYVYSRHKKAKAIQSNISDMTNPVQPGRSAMPDGVWGNGNKISIQK